MTVPTLVVTSPEVSAEDRTVLQRRSAVLPPDGAAGGMPVLGRGGYAAVAVFGWAVTCAVLLTVGFGPWWCMPVAGTFIGGSLAVVAERVGLHRTVRRNRERFLLTTDLDDEARQLYERVETAATDVLESSAVTDDFLDRADVEVTVRDCRWRIARDLYRQSRLRHRLDAAEAKGGRRTAAVVADQRVSLDDAVRATTNEVKRLERLAAKIRKVDVTYRDWRLAEELRIAHDDDCAELAADTERSVDRAGEIDRLTDTARTTTATIVS